MIDRDGTIEVDFVDTIPMVRTGKRLWTFHTVPQKGEFGWDTWANGTEKIGHVGVWTQMAIDEELGMVYLPVETPTNDYYGGHRLGNNLFAESLVCLDANTGKRVWHYQLVHHGIWDFDIPCAPILANITVGKPVAAPAPAAAAAAQKPAQPAPAGVRRPS